jgi:hypothetical protein
MEKPMKKPKLPKFKTIDELAKFWETHDSTDYEDELEEVTEPVFVRRPAIQVHLASREAKAVERMANAKGISREELIRSWVLEKLPRPSRPRRTKRPA